MLGCEMADNKYENSKIGLFIILLNYDIYVGSGGQDVISIVSKAKMLWREINGKE